MFLETGEKVHIVVRRMFETDLRRHFVGDIKMVNNSVARIQGYFIVFDKNKNAFIKKPVLRETIIDLSSYGYWVNIIPKEVNLEDLQYTYNSDRKLVLTDDKSFELDINEFGAIR